MPSHSGGGRELPRPSGFPVSPSLPSSSLSSLLRLWPSRNRWNILNCSRLSMAAGKIGLSRPLGRLRPPPLTANSSGSSSSDGGTGEATPCPSAPAIIVTRPTGHVPLDPRGLPTSKTPLPQKGPRFIGSAATVNQQGGEQQPRRCFRSYGNLRRSSNSRARP